MKSNVSDHLAVAESIYIDAAAECVADVSDLRDLETIRSRVKKEGLSFLTISLPNFCRDFERSLERGFVDSSYFQGFRKYGAIPAFLQGMLSLIFDRETGRIHDERILHPQVSVPTIVGSIRQICLAFKKLEHDCTPERTYKALEGFIAIEKSFETFSVPSEDLSRFRDISFVLWNRILAGICLDNCLPRHGPGATADKRSGNRKFVWRRWHDRIEPYFPFLDSAYSISAFESEELDLVTFVPEEQEQPVKVTPVPKTLKGPRIIAIEPCCMQYVQQGIRGQLYAAIESHWLTSGHVNFRDQSINQSLALIASSTHQLATIDLSDASDRVPRDLALLLFDSNPVLRDAIESCRSTHAAMPDGRVIGPLAKFASMGSALCFPVEAMYFYTLCVMAIADYRKLPYTIRNIFDVSRDVFVYGDDIIVPTDCAMVVLDCLQKYNCKVNESKTFVSGRFRESCGLDAYDGQVVTPIYIHHDRPKNKQQAPQLASWVASANLFYKRGYWRTASHMFAQCEKIIGPLPYVSEVAIVKRLEKSGGIDNYSGVLGRISYLGYRSIGRWNKNFQRFEVKAWKADSVYRDDKLEGYAALQKSLSKLDGLVDLSVSRDASHLEHSALHGAVALKRRWVPTER